MMEVNYCVGYASVTQRRSPGAITTKRIKVTGTLTLKAVHHL